MKLNYNNLYTFRYNPISLGKIEVFDKTPVIVLLNIDRDSILAVNFHWIQPKHERLEFFYNVMDIIQNNISEAKKQQRYRLTYELLKKPKYRQGLQAIRMYYLSGITALKMVPEGSMFHIFSRFNRAHYRARFVHKNKGYKE